MKKCNTRKWKIKKLFILGILILSLATPMIDGININNNISTVKAASSNSIEDQMEATEKFTLLKRFIKEKGLEDSEGNRYFEEVFQESSIEKYISRIYYIENECQFKFYYVREISDTKFSEVTMFIPENGSKNVTVTYEWRQAGIKAVANFDVEQYTLDNRVHFQPVSNFLEDSEDLQGMCNTYLSSGIVGWDFVLINNFMLDINMGNIGFTSYKKPADHTWDEGEITTSPTCKKEGIKTHTCIICEKSVEEIIPKTNHKWYEKTYLKQTCETPGKKEYACELCDEIKSETISASGHLWVEDEITKFPTATSTGIQLYTCYFCKKTKEEIIPSTGIELGVKIKNEKGEIYKVTKLGEIIATNEVEFIKKDKVGKTLSIPDTVEIDNIIYKVTSISSNAFKGNKKITKVTIGRNISRIGKNAFNGCTRLNNITIKTNKLTTKNVGKNAFKNINKKATVKVSSKKLKAYKKLLKKRGINKKTQKIKK